ncbi:hypothetical protein [Zymobacter sp. IVIA_5232.4 C2]|uniref:hypothetical protein n=1 Tax=Zymobacter sp. IVIA_5232.4 C2 TaxID=3394855 RepID=UPI0039C4D9D2
MTECNVTHPHRWQRTRQRWWAGFLFGCLLPVTLCHPDALARLDALSVRLTQVALHMSGQVSLRQRRTRLRRGHHRLQRRVHRVVGRIRQCAHILCRHVADVDALSRRGPPKSLFA